MHTLASIFQTFFSPYQWHLPYSCTPSTNSDTEFKASSSSSKLKSTAIETTTNRAAAQLTRNYHRYMLFHRNLVSPTSNHLLIRRLRGNIFPAHGMPEQSKQVSDRRQRLRILKFVPPHCADGRTNAPIRPKQF